MQKNASEKKKDWGAIECKSQRQHHHDEVDPCRPSSACSRHVAALPLWSQQEPVGAETKRASEGAQFDGTTHSQTGNLTRRDKGGKRGGRECM